MAEVLILQIAQNYVPRPRKFRIARNYVELNDEEFRRMYRVPRNVFHEVCEAVRPDLQGKTLQKTTVMNVEQKLLTALRFYGTGSYQQCIASDAYITCSQGQVSKCIMAVTEAIVNRLAHKISFPEGEAQKNRVKQGFYQKHGFPGVVGL